MDLKIPIWLNGIIGMATSSKARMVSITFSAARWDQSKGHNEWWNSKAVHAVSDTLYGPYVDMGLLWPNDSGGKGHNVTALVMPDGTYAVVVSETRPGDVFTSKSLGRTPGLIWEGLRWQITSSSASVG